MVTTRLNKPNPRDNRSKANNVRKDLERSLYLIKQKRLNKARSYEDNRSTCERSGCKNKMGYHSKRKFCSQCTDIEKVKIMKHNLLKKFSYLKKFEYKGKLFEGENKGKLFGVEMLKKFEGKGKSY